MVTIPRLTYSPKSKGRAEIMRESRGGQEITIKNSASLTVLLVCLVFCLFAFPIGFPKFASIFEDIGAPHPLVGQ